MLGSGKRGRIVPVKGGKGGANTNKTGLAFERKTSLEEALIAADFEVNGFKVYQADELKAELAPKYQFYKFLESKDVDWRPLVSKRLLPDDALFSIAGNRMNIIEKKWQETSGSVDEKLQTIGFKIRQYNRLLAPAGIDLKFIYLLNDWFTKPEYDDVRDYILETGGSYHFLKVPLSELEL
jgi:hypothetical protein